MKEISLGIIGLGKVGSSFLSILLERRRELEKRHGILIRVVFACNSKGGVYKEEGMELEEFCKLLSRGAPNQYEGWKEGLTGEDLISLGSDVVVEVTPTSFEEESPGMRHMVRALGQGSHVITSNKGPLALKFWDLMDLASKRGALLLFEGTVMSGTPVIATLRSLSPGRVLRMRGVLNGTTTFVLSEMEKGKDLSQALSEAILRGYAEKDPSNDIKGYDAAAKITILANYALKINKSVREVEIRGIEGISKEEVIKAVSEGRRIRLVAKAEPDSVSVFPEKVSKGDPLFYTSGKENCLIIEHEDLGKVIVKGPGAGGRETAFALLSDLSYLLSRIAPR